MARAKSIRIHLRTIFECDKGPLGSEYNSFKGLRFFNVLINFHRV